jgi:chitinase
MKSHRLLQTFWRRILDFRPLLKEMNEIHAGSKFYGYEWSNVPNIDQGLFEPGAPRGQGAACNFIVSIESQFQKRRDSITQALWLYNGTNFWTYDDATSIKFKMDYVRRRNLAGVMPGISATISPTVAC